MSGPRIEMAAASMPAANNPTRNNDYFELGWDGQTFALLDGRIPYHSQPLPVAEDYSYRAGARVAGPILADLSGFIPDDDAQAEHLLKDHLDEANRVIKTDVNVRQLQTTATIGMVRPTHGTHNQADAFIAHVGDSTVYRYRDGRVEIITPDHTASFHRFLADSDRDGHIDRQTLLASSDNPEHLSGSAQTDWKNRHALVRWLGNASVLKIDDIGFEYRALMPGDLLLATTDGVGNNLSLDEIAQLVAGSTKKARDVARLIVQVAANNSQLPDRGRRHFDDATVVVTTLS